MKRFQCRLIASGSSLGRSFCTETVQSTKEKVAAKPAVRYTILYKKLSALPVTGRTVEEILNEYKMEGKFIPKKDLSHCIRGLRGYGRIDHALEVFFL